MQTRASAMKQLCLLGLAAVIGLMCVNQNPAFARGGHGGHGHRGHPAHHAAGHAAHHGGHNRALAHRHVGAHNHYHAGHHAAWAHHYAHNRHCWGHQGWGYHHGWGYRHGWGWGGWNWYGGGVNVVGPSVVNPGYVNPNVVVVPGSNASLAPTGLYSMLGTISTIRGNAVSIVGEEGNPVTIDATPNTRFVVNSQPSTLADLRPSDRVKVRYDKNLNAMTLVAVR